MPIPTTGSVIWICPPWSTLRLALLPPLSPFLYPLFLRSPLFPTHPGFLAFLHLYHILLDGHS